jgi:uncharacterized C2H2 Zn-finger protein
MPERLHCPFCPKVLGSRNWVTRHINANHSDQAARPALAKSQRKTTRQSPKCTEGKDFEKQPHPGKSDGEMEPKPDPVTSAEEAKLPLDVDTQLVEKRVYSGAIGCAKIEAGNESPSRIPEVLSLHHVDNVEKPKPTEQMVSKCAATSKTEIQPDDNTSSQDQKEKVNTQKENDKNSSNLKTLYSQETAMAEEQQAPIES